MKTHYRMIHKTMKILMSLMLMITLFSCTSKSHHERSENQEQAILMNSQEVQDSIIEQHLNNGAWTKGLYSREWQEEIDKGLAKDSTISYLWQQKAMPLYKQGKYELATMYIDQAVKYNRDEHQDYRAFMKCIFSKNYAASIIDFEDIIKRKGNSYVMDHSYYFYIALCKLQLNEFAEAEKIYSEDIANQIKSQGEDWVHYLDYFYYGVSKYELGKYEEAIEILEKVFPLYPEFAEAHYYKAKCLRYLEKKEEALKTMQKAIDYGKKGYSVNEDNSIYEKYPYQVRWELYE